MGKICFDVRVPIGSILYAPLLVLHEQNHQDRKSKFRFHIVRTDGEIKLSKKKIGKYNLHALAPLSFDPCFSPVIDSARYKGKKEYMKSWFALGDPLRVIRLIQGIDTAGRVSFSWLGNLIGRLSFWVAYEATNSPRLYNIVACHDRGMTGYHIAATLFGPQTLPFSLFNPLAQTQQPGAEVDYFFKMYAEDKLRRFSDDDGVVFALVTTEIAKLRHHLSNKHKKAFTNGDLLYRHLKEFVKENAGSSKDIKRLSDWYASNDGRFLMTSIVARKCGEGEPDGYSPNPEAENFLRDGLIRAIELFGSDSVRFTTLLERSLQRHLGYYGQHHIPPPSDWEEVVPSLRAAYTEKLISDNNTAAATDGLLEELILSDSFHANVGLERDSDEHMKHAAEVFSKYKTEAWPGAVGNLWQ